MKRLRHLREAGARRLVGARIARVETEEVFDNNTKRHFTHIESIELEGGLILALGVVELEDGYGIEALKLRRNKP